MSRTISRVSAAFLIPFLSFAAAGQAQTSSWDAVKMITPGTEVRVSGGNSEPVRGKLESVTNDNLVIQQKTGVQSFARPEIRRVDVKKKGHRLRNTLIGLGVGTGSGLGAGFGATRTCNEIECTIAGASAIGIGIVAGTVIGLVWPTGGWRKIYVP